MRTTPADAPEIELDEDFWRNAMIVETNPGPQNRCAFARRSRDQAVPLWVWPWLFVGGFVFFLVVETEKLIIRTARPDAWRPNPRIVGGLNIPS